MASLPLNLEDAQKRRYPPDGDNGEVRQVSQADADAWQADIESSSQRKIENDRHAAEANGRPQRKRLRDSSSKSSRFGMVLASVIENVEFRPATRIVYSVLACNADKFTNECTLSVAEICRRTGFSKRLVLYAIEELKKAGIVKRKSGKGERRTLWFVKIGGK